MSYIALPSTPQLVTPMPFEIETWNGVNGASWAAQWTQSGSGTADIQNGSGHHATAAGAYTTKRSAITGSADGEVLFKRLVTDATLERYDAVYFRYNAGTGNGYYIQQYPTDNLALSRIDGGVPAGLASGSVTFTANIWYWTRIRWVGASLKVRVWADGTEEPDAWTLSATDTTYTTAQTVLLETGNGATGQVATAYFDKFNLWNLNAATASRLDRKSGNVSLTNTAWGSVDAALDLTLAAAAEQWVEVGMSVYIDGSAPSFALDFVTLVSGSAVSSIAGNTVVASRPADGILEFYTGAGSGGGVGGTIIYQLTAADISGGTVTLRLQCLLGAAGTKVLEANANDPLSVWARIL